MPAKAGIQGNRQDLRPWIPAFAGMTTKKIEGPERARSLKHRLQDAVRGLVAVDEGLDVDDDLLAHVEPAFQGGRAHMRQQHHIAELEQLRVYRGLMLE